MNSNSPTAAQRNMNARMTHEEAVRLARQFKAQPYTSYYRSISETTGKERVIYHADALYILEARGLLAGEVAA